MTEPHLVLVFWFAGVGLAGALVWWGYLDFRRNAPHYEHHGIGVRYLAGALVPWPGIDEAIDSAWAVLMSEYPNDYLRILHNMWIEAVAYEGFCKSPTVPTGYVTGPSGASRVTGTQRLERALGIGPGHWCMICRQLRAGDSSEQNRLANGTGAIRSAGESAFFHELAQHHVPFILRGDINAAHKDPKASALELRMVADYATRFGVTQPVGATCYRDPSPPVTSVPKPLDRAATPVQRPQPDPAAAPNDPTAPH